jgi:hypothetical protein
VKALDVLGTGVKAAARAVASVMAPPAVLGPDALEELRRRADANARTEAERAERADELFGSGRWLRRRSNWLSRRP